MMQTLGLAQSIGRNCWCCSALIDTEASKSRQIHKKTSLESNKSASEEVAITVTLRDKPISFAEQNF